MRLSDSEQQNFAANTFFIVLSIAAVGVGLWASIFSLTFSLTQICFFAALAVPVFAANFFALRSNQISKNLPCDEVFIFLGIVFVSAPAGILLAFVGFLASLLTIERGSQKSAILAHAGKVLSVGFAGIFFTKTIGLFNVETSVIVLAVLAAAIVYLLTVKLFSAAQTAFAAKRNLVQIISESFNENAVWYAASVFGGALATIAFFAAAQQSVWLILPVIIAYGVFFYGFRVVFDKNERRTRSLMTTSKLNLSVVEALSSAIVAREQLSPNHIRRVQIYAVGLGHALNLGTAELSVLENAALLHGVGKLAVPDYILNKPGSLTASEKERVKMHSLVSTEIVESIPFEFPVSDAIKYYNENWDGCGYPDGLRGAEIPLTAQILGLANAYDTMRENRPYRQSCTREEARRMLLAGAGTRFDPKLVDVFLRNLSSFEAKIDAALIPLDVTPEPAANLHTTNESVPRYLDQIRQTNREVFALYELARLSSASLSMQELLPFLTEKVQELVPCETVAVYLYDARHETAQAVYTNGKNAAFLLDRKVKIGETVTGFVLKNEKPVGSVNPTLDLTHDYAVIASEYKTMAAMPLLANQKLVGVLTVYSANLSGYDAEHLRLLETVSRISAEAIARTVQQAESENRALTDSLTNLPNARSLHVQFEKEIARARRANRPLQFVMLDLDKFKKVNDTYGHKIGDIMLCEVAKILRTQFREYDFVARYAGDEFIALVPELNDDRVAELCERIENAVTEFSLPIRKKPAARVGISIGTASFPHDGETFDQLLIAADQNMYSVKASHNAVTYDEIEIEIQSIN